jgi:hypothetical protein
VQCRGEFAPAWETGCHASTSSDRMKLKKIVFLNSQEVYQHI